MRILLDLDCCLADFIGGVAKLWDVPLDTLLANWELGVYGVYGPLAKALHGPDAPPLSAGDFWQRLDGNAVFWSGLEPLPWCRDLIELCEEYAGPEVYIVTSPSWCSHSYLGKAEWVKTMFGRNYTNLIPTPHKYLLAKPGVVLIDDFQDNCDRFVSDPLLGPTGGTSILFPAHHNGLHGWKDSPLPIVERSLALAKEAWDAR